MNENDRIISYPSDYDGDALFVPRCPLCGRFVKPDEKIFVNDLVGLKDAPNGTCKKDGRVKMYFLGFM